jgi:hypothetical protein
VVREVKQLEKKRPPAGKGRKKPWRANLLTGSLSTAPTC